MKRTVLGIIPARGGSKGIPRKNIKPIAGRPLLAWTIAAARASRLLDDFFVSTEDAEIAAVARRFGAKVIDRPARLATDRATAVALQQHALSLHDAEAVVLLQPTSPVREPGLIDRCIRRFFRARADNLATGFICKFQEYGPSQPRRQELKGFFYDDGNVYVTRAGLIRRGLMFGRRVERVAISKKQNVDINDPFDFWLTEQILLRQGCAERST
jgi:N-acylneuraminate cytidylyltransferase